MSERIVFQSPCPRSEFTRAGETTANPQSQRPRSEFTRAGETTANPQSQHPRSEFTRAGETTANPQSQRPISEFTRAGETTANPQSQRPRSEFTRAAETTAKLHRRSRPGTAKWGQSVHNVPILSANHYASDYNGDTTVTTSSLATEQPAVVTPLPGLEQGRSRMIRPLSAFYPSSGTNRYLTERLRAMYRQRRASSATSRVVPSIESQSGESINAVSHSEELDDVAAPRTSFSNLQPLTKFRKLAYVTIYLRRLMGAIIDNCCTKTMRSANELQWMTVYAEKHDLTLAFNKHLFSRDRVSTHVPDWALSILHLQPEDRSEQDCLRLHALLRGMKSFDKFTGEIQMFLCRAFTLDRVAEGRVVLKTGHVGINFYLIYSGSVFVNSEDWTRDGRQFVRTVAVLTRGESFGELALLQDIRRTATVSVRERCELLAVDKKVFASVCPRIFEKELAEKYSFLSSLDLFAANYWSSESIRSLAMNAQIQEYKINKVIVTDSTTENWIYICMQGRCHVIRCLSLDQPITEDDKKRKMSEVVLSEEILQLLSASSVDHGTKGESRPDENMKENLLTSLGLDYVQTGKKLYTSGDQGTKANANETMTLTTYVKRHVEGTVKDYVILRLGIIEARQIFDLQSLLDPSGAEPSSALMLVSGGAKVVRVKKAAFFDQVSQQALDNTRTMASKRRNPSDEAILVSYKCKVAWDEFKANLVQNVLESKKRRYQPTHRAKSSPAEERMRKPQSHTGSTSKSSRIMSALRRNHLNHSKTPLSFLSWLDDSSSEEEDGDDNVSLSALPATLGRNETNYLNNIESSNKNDVIIMRRHLSRTRTPKIVVKTKDIPPRFPRYT